MQPHLLALLLLVPICLRHGEHILITSFTPASSTVRQPAVAATSGTIGPLPQALIATPTVWVSAQTPSTLVPSAGISTTVWLYVAS